MTYSIEITDTFTKEFKKHRKDGEFLHALDKKIQKLKENPESVGGMLSGDLHGFRSTRIIRKFRLIFRIFKEESKVQLAAIDHRKTAYEFEGD